MLGVGEGAVDIGVVEIVGVDELLGGVGGERVGEVHVLVRAAE